MFTVFRCLFLSWARTQLSREQLSNNANIILFVYFLGLAPSPLCGMILADYGASVIRVDKIGAGLNYDVTSRGKKSISLNLKNPEGAQILKKLCVQSDVVIEPFRAGIFYVEFFWHFKMQNVH